MDAESSKAIRQRLVKHLKGGQAFSPINQVIEKVPFDKLGIVPDGLPYSFYQLFYHIQISQADILEYCRDENYQTPNWPDDYWPKQTKPASKEKWQDLVSTYLEEREQFCNLILDENNSLLEPFASNPEHNLLRQSQLIIEHTSYHAGQLFVIYRLLKKTGSTADR